MSERETAVRLPFAADCFRCVEKLRTVLPFSVGIRDGVVHLVSTLGSAVISSVFFFGGGGASRTACRGKTVRRVKTRVPWLLAGCCSDGKVANRTIRVWDGATENGLCTRDTGHTFAAYVYPSVRATILEKEVGGRRETARVSSLASHLLRFATCHRCMLTLVWGMGCGSLWLSSSAQRWRQWAGRRRRATPW
jgi:hypothetical protein